MKTLYMLIGVTGAGKSTHSKFLKEQFGGEILESDEVRKELVSNYIIPDGDFSFSSNSLVFKEVERRFERLAKEGESIIFDATNLRISNREKYISLAKKYKYKVQGEVLLLDKEECVRRIIKRQTDDPNSHYIEDPKAIVERFSKNLQENWPNLQEGYDVLNFYENGILTKSNKRILIASTNVGKVAIYAEVLDKMGVQYCSLRDLSVNLSVEETGTTEIENAILKATAYHNETQLPVIANDSGLVIDKFAPEEQPGVFVRRYGGRELSDEETINIFSQKLAKVGGESDAHFNVALAICDENNNVYAKTFKSYRYMVSTPSKIVQKGLPLRSLDYNKEKHKYMSEMNIKEANECEAQCLGEQEEFINECLLNKISFDENSL